MTLFHIGPLEGQKGLPMAESSIKSSFNRPPSYKSLLCQ
jgi:hypothetical protein